MKTQHTPTPWAKSGGFDELTGADGTKVIISAELAAGFGSVTHYPKATANAAFIVLAVNTHDALFEALRGLLDCPIQCDCTPRQQDSGHCAGCWFPGYIDRHNQAISALALLK